MVGCNTKTDHKKGINTPKIFKIVDTLTVDKDSLVLNGNEGNWYYKKQLFNGYAVKYYSNKNLKEKIGFYNGKKQGIYRYWFPNKVLKIESNYNQNVLVDNYTCWWINGKKSLEVFYKNGKKEGVEYQWYTNGILSKERNLLNGKENGLQKAWLKNGKIYVNYEAKNGRIFGMKRANLCYQLKNEKIAENQVK